MANYVVDVPIKGLKTPLSKGSRETLKQTLLKINKAYRPYLDFASKETNIPIQILISVIATESGGDPKAGGCRAVSGLMQWNRVYAKGILELENSTGRLSDAEKKVLSKYGLNFNKSGKLMSSITCNQSLNPELNILIGSIYLGQIISELGQGGSGYAIESGNKLRLDKVLAMYNAGAYGSTGKLAKKSQISGRNVDTTTVQNFRANLLKIGNSTSANYINLILGEDGFLDILTSDLSNLF